MHALTATHAHTYAYACMHTHIHICAHIYAHTHDAHIHMHKHTYVRTSTHAQTYTHMYIHLYTHAHSHTMRAFTCIWTHAHTHSARNQWYLILHAQALRSWEDASISRHGKVQANLLPASGVSKGLEVGHHMGPPAATWAVHVQSLSKERWQFPKSKLIVSNQIN